MKTSAIEKTSAELSKRLASASVWELESWVRHHNRQYFELHDPEITDDVFDKLVEVLRQKSPDSFVLQEIGESFLEELDPKAHVVSHRIPMLSLDKCYDEDAFEKWKSKVKDAVIAMPKIDGVACSLVYQPTGALRFAATRGDGKQGENVTENVKRIANIPKYLSKETYQAYAPESEFQGQIEVRGEVYLAISRFQSHYQTQFANPRNLAAGALKQKEPKQSEAYGLLFIPYNIHGLQIPTEEAKFQLLEQLGFTLPDVRVLQPNEQAKPIVEFFIKRRLELDYEIDGIVWRANLVSEQTRLGYTAHHPRWSIAYKFQGEKAQAHLLGVEWSVGRSGVITPVAHITPVYVSGAQVRRASLHHYGMFQKLHLRTNTLLEVVRRGGVIPHVEMVLSAEGDDLKPPEQCPSCGGPVVQEEDFLFCRSPDVCFQVIVNRIGYYCAILGIEGFGQKWITILVQRKLLTRISDLYRLKREQLLALERMGDVLAGKLLLQIEQKRVVPLDIFLPALPNLLS